MRPRRAIGARLLMVFLSGCLLIGAVATGTATASTGATAASASCDEIPTGVDVSDHWLQFKVPPGLMPDPRFDGRPAKLEVHRVRPVYAHGRCPSVAVRAAVFVHGRTALGPAVFDL